MRVLLDTTGEVGLRAGHVLLAERDVSFIGLWNNADARKRRRSGPARDVDGFDVAVSDRTDHFDDLRARCSVASIPLVLWADAPEIHAGPSSAPVIRGANVGSGLAEVLVHHPSALRTHGDQVTIGWTEPGRPLRSGTAVAFPEPVGVSWTRARSRGHHVAYRDDEWGGATILLDGEAGERIIGVADHSAHLEALVLSAATLIAAQGGYESLVGSASDAGEQLLNKLRYLELDFAVWRSES